MALTLRLVKGSALTFIETDDNFSQLANLESGVHTGQLLLTASTINKASLRIPHGDVPTFPVNGDMWTTSSGLYIQINGSTVGPLGIGGGGGGTGVTSFNTRTGAVTLNSPDVTNALGYTPVNRAGDTLLGKLTTVTSSSSTASIRLPHGSAPTSPINGDMWTTADGLYVRINGTTVGPLGGGAGSYLPLSGGTLTGLLTTAASTTSAAGLRLPHGSAPTSPINGDMWTTTTGLFIRINGTTVGPLGTGGGDLSNLNASNLTSGTVPSARMSGAYTGITGLGTLSSLTCSGDINARNLVVTPTSGSGGVLQFKDRNGGGSFSEWSRSSGVSSLYDSSAGGAVISINSSGQVSASSFNTGSSRTIKKNIRRVKKGALSRVVALAKQVKEYQLRADVEGKLNIGVIAEDTPQRYSDGKSVNINNVLFDLVAAVGELYGERV